MTSASSTRIGSLVLRMQGAFLDTPGLTLTLADAQRRFDVDQIVCEAILGVLVDAGVLTRTPGGAYSRLFPREQASIRRAASAGASAA